MVVKNRLKLLNKKMPSKQDEKNLLVDFIRYMFIGVNTKQVRNDLHMSNSEFQNIMNGNEHNLSKYQQVIRYIKDNVPSARNDLNK